MILAAIAALQIVLLLSAALTDVASRLISDRICLMLVIAGVACRLLTGPLAIAESLIVATCLLLMFLPMHGRGWIGGGDVKLLVALAIGFSLTQSLRMITITAFAGGGLLILHLMIDLLPHPAVSPAGSSLLRRVYAVERWRILRRAPVPYGVAIAFGGIWTVLLTIFGE